MRKLTTQANRLGKSHANRMRTATMAVVAAFVMVSIGACSSIDCPVQNTVSTQYAFATAAGERDTLADTLTVSTIRQNGTDSILLNRSVMTTDFSLPVSYTANADTLQFLLADTTGHTMADTVVVMKTNTPHFESVDCNISFFHEITGVTFTRHFIDTIIMRNKTVNYDTSTLHFNIVRKKVQ